MNAKNLILSKYLLICTLLAFIMGATTTMATAQIVHFDHLEGRHDLYFGPDPGDGGAAQMFKAGEGGNVTAVTIELARLGFPGGKMVFSIWDVDTSARRYPGKLIGKLGEIEINSLTQPPLPIQEELDTVTVKGLVSGLNPGEEYYLVVEHDADATITFIRNTWLMTGSQATENPGALIVFQGGRWQRPFPGNHLRVRIEGMPLTEAPRISTGYHVSWPGNEGEYILEVADFSDGPWTPFEGIPAEVDGKNIVVMDLQERSKFYRLTKVN